MQTEVDVNMKLTGTCQSDVRRLEGKAAIECDPEEHRITVFFPVADPLAFIRGGKESVLNRPVRLRDIHLASHTARFRISRLPPAFFSSMNVGGYSVDDGQVDVLLNLNNNDTGVVKLDVTLRTGKLALDIVDSPAGKSLTEELVFTNHSRYMSEAFSVKLGNRNYEVRYASRRLFVHGRMTESHRDVFGHTCSLLALTAESVVAHLRPPRVVLNMYIRETKGYGEEVVSKPTLPSSFQELAEGLLSMSSAERNRAYNEVTYVVSGFEESRLIDERLTSLFKALESFDGCRTLSPQGCASLLGIHLDDARYVCHVRNKMIHSGMSLGEAGLAAYNDVNSRRRANLDVFSKVRARRDLPWKLYVTMARLITTAFFRHLGVKQPPNVFAGMRAC